MANSIETQLANSHVSYSAYLYAQVTEYSQGFARRTHVTTAKLCRIKPYMRMHTREECAHIATTH